jgi:hypothetical protein
MAEREQAHRAEMGQLRRAHAAEMSEMVSMLRAGAALIQEPGKGGVPAAL